jgi:phage gp46-like protein
MTALVRRCRWLLRAYPADYRRERGEEILTTLLEASPPGRSWPAPRDARALITGGLGVRAWQNQRQSTAASLRLAVLLGAALALLWIITDQLGGAIQVLVLASTHPSPIQPGPDIGYLIASDVLALAAVVAAWFAPRPAVAVLALAAAATRGHWGDRSMAIQLAGLLILAAILVSGRQRLPRSWLWLAGAMAAANLLDHITGVRPLFAVHDVLNAPLLLVPWVILGAVVLWAAVDARPTIALAIWITSSYLPDASLRMSPYLIYTWQWYLPAAGSAALAAAAIWRLRHQAAL